MYAQQQLAYAPTPYSYTPSSNLAATINLDEVGSTSSSHTPCVWSCRWRRP